RDLNRSWSAAALAAPATGDHEERERAELRAAIDAAVGEARGPVTSLDLHTTSAAGVPFALVADTVRCRQLAAQFPLPSLLGLEEQIDGVLNEYLAARGATALSIEGGQHAGAEARANLEAALTIAVHAAGLGAPPGLARARDTLARARGTLPHV